MKRSGVTLFKTCTAEVFRPASKDENRSFQVFETRKDSAVHVSLSSSSLVKQPGIRRPQLPSGEVRKTLIRRQMTTDGYRLLFTHHHEELDGHDRLPWPRGQCSAALSGRVIVPPNRRCQRLSSTKLHIESENLRQRGNPYISGLCAVLEPQSCDVLTIS